MSSPSTADKTESKDAGDDAGADGSIPVFGWVLFIAGMLLLGSYATMAKLAEGEDGKPPVPIPFAILLIEFTKFTISLVRLCMEIGFDGVVSALFKLTWSAVLPYGMPGLIYMLNNNLEIFVLNYMDPATSRLLNNGKILSTAILFRMIMKKHITFQQGLSLAMLLIGASVAVFTQNTSQSSSGEMFVTPVGIALMTFYCFNSGLASVTNEWIMKKGVGADQSIHLQNCILYTYGLLFNGLGVLSDLYSSSNSGGTLWDSYGFTSSTQRFWWTCFVVNGAVHGLVIANVMKYLSSIYKLFMSGAAMLTAGLLQRFLLGASELPPSWFGAMFVIFLAMYMYNTPGLISWGSGGAKVVAHSGV